MPQTNNTKQAMWVAIGNMCAYGFAIVSSMILSRYFNKADYGTYKQVIYVYTTLTTVFTLGLPRAYSYFLPRVELSQSNNMIRKITLLFFLLGAIFSAVLFFLSPLIASVLKNPDLDGAMKVFAIVPFLMLPTLGVEGILATYKYAKLVAVYHISTNILKLLCVALPVMIWGLGYMEALYGFVIASVITFLLALYLKNYPVRGQSNEKCGISYKTIFGFSIPLMVASLWGMLINAADQFFISRYYGNEVFAEFSNGSIPLPFLTMVTGACATVLSPIFSRMNHEQVDPLKEVYPLFMSVFKKSAKLTYPLIIYCVVFADVLMVALYGDAYQASAPYLRIKSVADFFTIIAFAPLLINIGKVKYYSFIHLITAICVIVLEYIAVLLFKTPLAIAFVSLFCHLFKIFLALHGVATYFGVKMEKLFPWQILLNILIPSTIILMTEHLILVEWLEVNAWLSLFVSLAFYLILFGLYSFVAKLDYISIIKPLLVKTKTIKHEENR